MTSMKAASSICLATHNGGKYLRPQLQSLCEQTALAAEVVVVDDTSTDDTMDELRSRFVSGRPSRFASSGIGHGSAPLPRSSEPWRLPAAT